MKIALFESSKGKTIFILISRVIIAVVGIIFVPVYVRLIGPESYGLVAFYATLAGAMLILDLGLSTAISRQVSILEATEGHEKEIKDLIFSVETIYWSIGLISGVLIILYADFLARAWVISEHLSISTIRQTIMLIGCTLAFQFPVSIYNGVLIGLEKQITSTLISVYFSLIKNIGVIPFLLIAGSTVQNYFIWQISTVALMTFSLWFTVWKKNLPPLFQANFSIMQLKSIWKFAAGMAGISIITFAIREIDKIVVSKMVLLEFVGYYNLAFLISGGLIQLISPLQIVFFPKLTKLHAQNKSKELLNLYHKSARWISIIIFPVGLTMIFYSYELLYLWTGNTVLSENTSPILKTFTIGTIISCIMWLPYSYLMAIGNTKFTLVQNGIALIILVPMLLLLTKEYGIYGASVGWMMVNIGYLIISAPIFHHYYFKGELWRWYLNDLSIPLIISLALLFIGKFVKYELHLKSSLPFMITLLSLTSLIYILLIKELRIVVLTKFYLIKKNIFVKKKK